MKSSNYSILFTILILIASNGHAQITYNSSKADSLIHSLTSQKLSIGVSAAVSINGEIIWEKEDGFMDLKKSKSFTTTTKNRTASIAKPITAVAIMQLVEIGKIDLDLPVQTYLPNFPESKLGRITTRHLLNHTSGISGYKGKEANSQKEYKSLDDALQLFMNRDLLFEPGTAYHYTSYGYVVLGAIIERVSGKNYNAYVQTNIFDVAGMRNTGIELSNKSYSYKNEILHRNGKGKIAPVKKVNNLSGRVPAGGFYSTTKDLIAFGNALLNGTLLSKSSMEDMFLDPKIRPIEEGNPYTKGWHIYNKKPPVGRILGHSGGQYGTSSQIMVLPELNAVVVIMSNTSGSLNQIRNQTIRLINCANLDKDYTVQNTSE